jgi:ubiquinone/menaquinone biosynthesis C-methylase UbiE
MCFKDGRNMCKVKILLLFIIAMGLKISANQLDTEYTKEFTDLIESVYGSKFLSQGGSESVDRMFEGQILENKKLLDIGSGLGGVDFYLAQKYHVDIIGVDCVSRLVDDANKRKATHKLIGNVTFVHQNADDSSYPYADSVFDIVFSKESLLHVDDKASLLKEIFRVLKPGGQLIILDWLVDTHELSQNINEMMTIDGLDLKMATSQEYETYLHDAGFTHITSSLMNDHYIRYTHDNIEKIKSHKADFIKSFGKKNYEYSLQSWALQKKIFERNEVLVTLLKATKSF